MKKTCLALCLCFALWHCTNDSNDTSGSIAGLEAQFDQNADGQIANELLAAYDTFIAENPEKEDQVARYLYRKAGILYRLNKNNEAINALNEAIRKFPDNPNTPNCALLVATILSENFYNEQVPLSIYQCLEQKSLDDTQQNTIAEKLPANTPPLMDRIKGMQAQIFDDSLGRINYRFANDYIQSCLYYAYLLPQKEDAPEVALRAAETARTIRTFPVALELYETIYERYPQHPKASQALFLQAFTLDNDLKKLDEAKALYETFLEKFPTDDFADDTKFLLKNLGKNDQEIIESFTRQQGDGN